MCEEAGVEYKHATTPPEMGASYFGGQGTNLAPPIVEIDGVSVSQAVACHQFLGNKLGFNKNIEIPELAVQYMADLDDLHSQMADKAIAGKKTDDVLALQEYVTSDRYKQHLQSIDRSIKGPFYFGDEPTYVDFAVCSYLDMCVCKWLGPLEVKSGDTIATNAPKLKAVYDAICNLESATKDGFIKNTPRVPPPFILSPERVGTWKD